MLTNAAPFEQRSRTRAHGNGDRREAANTLGMSLKTLYTRLAAYRAAGPETGPSADVPARVTPATRGEL